VLSCCLVHFVVDSDHCLPFWSLWVAKNPFLEDCVDALGASSLSVGTDVEDYLQIFKFQIFWEALVARFFSFLKRKSTKFRNKDVFGQNSGNSLLLNRFIF
jgi:hypothetical protein